MVEIKTGIAIILFVNFIALWIFKTDSNSQYSQKPLEESWKNSQAWQEYKNNLSIEPIYANFINDDKYCEKVAKFRKNNPVKFNSRGVPIKYHKRVYSDIHKSKPSRRILENLVTLVHEQSFIGSQSKELKLFSPSIIIFFNMMPDWLYNHEIGKHFLCEGQRHNQIPGTYGFYYKDLVVDNILNYAKSFKNREHCFDPWKFHPYTLNLVHKDQCEEFRNILYEATNSTSVNWIHKKSRDAHRGQGVNMVDADFAQELIEDYICPYEERFIAQKYLNPLLVDKKKFDIRAFMFIASMDPLIVLYRDGYAKVTLKDFDSDSADMDIHVTNTIVVTQNMTSEEKEKVDRQIVPTFKELESDLQKQGIVGQNWLEKELKPELKKYMMHLIRMNLHNMLTHPRVFKLVGIDYLIDEHHHLWFLECVLRPAYYENRLYGYFSKLTEELLDIEFALEFGGDVDKIIEESGFEWVYDGRKTDFSRFHNTINPECI